jgi:hypothetical protein
MVVSGIRGRWFPDRMGLLPLREPLRGGLGRCVLCILKTRLGFFVDRLCNLRLYPLIECDCGEAEGAR